MNKLNKLLPPPFPDVKYCIAAEDVSFYGVVGAMQIVIKRGSQSFKRLKPYLSIRVKKSKK